MIEEIIGAESINRLVKKFNKIQDRWLDLYKPVSVSRAATLKAALLNKTPGAELKHVLQGVPLAIIASSTEPQDVDSVQQMIKIDHTSASNPIQIETGHPQLAKVVENMNQWIESTCEAFAQMGEVAIQLASVPEEVTEITRNSVSEFGDMEIIDKSKMIKLVAGKSSQIKDRCEEITETMK